MSLLADRAHEFKIWMLGLNNEFKIWMLGLNKGQWSLLRPAQTARSQGQAGHNVKLQTVKTS